MADTNVTLTLAMRDEDFKKKLESIKENIGNIRSNKEEQIKEFSENIDESLENGKLMQTNALISNTQKLNNAIDILSNQTNKFVKDTFDERMGSVRNIVVNNVLSSMEDIKDNISSSNVLANQFGGDKKCKFKIKYSI
tara:strand:+ start:3928 stop:4341 length:414 start_codon:yes stop_codon:yes gene_type:complete